MQKVTDPALLSQLNGSAPQQAPQPRRPVFIADQGAIDDANRADTSLGYQGEGNQRDARREIRDIGNTQFDQAKKLRDEFNALPVVQDYSTVLKNLDIALHTTSSKAGDQDLIYALAQLRDPKGSVREGDSETIEGGQSFVQKQIARLKSELGSDGRFDPRYREELRKEAIGRLNSSNRAYVEARQRYRGLAEQYQFDPKTIVGDHAGAPFVERFRAYDERAGIGSAVQQPDPSGRVPGATMDNITFDMDTGQGAFGSEIKGPRMTPPQEAAYRSFIQANMGNPNFGPEQVDAFYRSIGLRADLTGSDAFFEAVRKGEAVGDLSYARTDEAAKRAAMEASLAEAPEGTDLSTVGMEKGLLLNMTDELRGGIGGVRSMLGGEGFMSGYQSERDIERALQERSRQQNGLVPELVGGLLTPAGMMSKANMARDAAGMGAIAGFGEGEGLQDSLAKSATGAGVGYGAGKAFDVAAPMVANSALGQRVSQALNNRGQDATEFASAAARQGLDYLPADIPGRTGTQFATSIAKSTLGGIPLQDAAVKIVEKAKSARDRIAGGVGAVADNVGAGQSAQRGMQAWEKQTAGRGGDLYEAIPIKPDTPVALTATRQKLAELNSSISSNDELAALVRDPKMMAYQKALEAGDLSWNDIKQFRSYIGEKAGRPTLQQDTSKDSLDALYGSLSQDIQQAASAHSPEAAKAFSRANNYWRGRQTRLNDVMTKLVGKDGNMAPEATFAQIERWAGVKGGDYGTLARAVRSMPADEANTVRATIIDRLGDASAGRQNAEGNAFSPDTFLTQWSNLSDRAKAVLFQGEHRKALDDLATVFDGSKASRGFDNASRTGIATSGLGTLAAIMLEPITGSAIAGSQFLTGKLLASPKFARWLAASSKKPNPSAQLAHVNQLTAIARAEPVIANDIFTLQEMLAKEFSRSPGAAAAEDSGDGRGVPPAQGERGNAP